MPRVHPKGERPLHCPKTKKRIAKNEMEVENGNKPENGFKNEGENEFPGAKPDLKPRKTRSQTNPENEK
jgi:hypothetical protein